MTRRIVDQIAGESVRILCIGGNAELLGIVEAYRNTATVQSGDRSAAPPIASRRRAVK